MLLSFKIKNFRSFKEEQKISFVLDKDEHIDPERRFEVNTKNGKIRVLKNAIIYGANASGKTNVLLALRTLSQIIIHPTRSDNEGLFSDSFASNRDNTRFEIEFLKEDIIFEYHLEYSRKEVVYESLYKDDTMIFERNYQEFVFPSLDKAVENLLKTVRKTGLLLFFAQNYNVQDTQNAFSWFFDYFYASSKEIIDLLKTDRPLKERVLCTLQLADFNIVDIEIEEHQARLRDRDGFKLNDADGIALYVKENEVYFIHENNGEKFRISLGNESEGTKAFFEIVLLLLSRAHGSCLFRDEIDSSLHKRLTTNLVKLLNNENNHIQLISTSHDSSLMDLLTLHQIYFVEKDVEGESEIFKLSDFVDIRSDVKYAPKYEAGLFGADQIINEEGFMYILGDSNE